MGRPGATGCAVGGARSGRPDTCEAGLRRGHGDHGKRVDGKWFGVLDSLLWAAGFVDSSSIEPIEEAIKERLDRPIEGLSTNQFHPRSVGRRGEKVTDA